MITVAGFSSASFLYESAKDCLKWNRLDIKEHIKAVMAVGNLVNMSDEDFEKIKNETQFIEIDEAQLKALYNS